MFSKTTAIRKNSIIVKKIHKINTEVDGELKLVSKSSIGNKVRKE